MNKNSGGIRITSFSTHSPGKNWKVLPITKDTPLTTQTTCPCDEQPLDTLCTLVSADTAVRMRIGSCDACGYIGYIDRPTQEWLATYYRTHWQLDEERDITDIKGSKYTREAIPLLKSLNVDPAQGVCEIGCGYGFDLEAFAMAGFAPTVGTENSEKRARIAHEKYGHTTVVGPFESADVQNALKKQAPFGVVYSAHVLEHTAHPATVIDAAASLQETGGVLVLAVPDVDDESPMNIITFLPHLHAFSSLSLENLLSTNGYQVIDGPRRVGAGHYVVARRTDRNTQAMLSSGCTARAIDRFTTHLHTTSVQHPSYMSWFLLKSDASLLLPRWLPITEGGLFYKALAHYARHVAHLHGTVVNFTQVEALQKRVTDPTTSPIEIAFAGEIELFIK